MTTAPTLAEDVSAADPAARSKTPRRWTVWPLRVTLTALALLCLSQPVSIGQYLNGVFGGLSVHSLLGSLVAAVAILALAAGALHVWLGRGRWHLLPALAVLFLAAGAQIGFGYSRSLGVHIPLGVLIVAMSVVLAIWSWTPRVRRTRGRRSDPA